MQTESETIPAERWTAHQAKVAHHEAAHAVAHERLATARPLYLALEGSPDAPGRDGLDGRVCALDLPDADSRSIGISMLAGPAADMQLDGEALENANDADEIRYFADCDTPDDDDEELCSLWAAAVDFVAQNWAQIQAVASALLASPAPPDSDMTHFLRAQDFRRILERTA